MSIWVFSCSNESSDRWICGYFTRELTEEEQHAYFKEHYDYEYDVDGTCYIYWELIELVEELIPAPLPKDQWSEGL